MLPSKKTMSTEHLCLQSNSVKIFKEDIVRYGCGLQAILLMLLIMTLAQCYDIFLRISRKSRLKQQEQEEYIFVLVQASEETL